MTDLTRRKKELLKSYNNLCSCYGDIISEQTKTINRLKELLRECRTTISENISGDYIIELCERITNAIGEEE